jgi:hypothetical protein
MVILRSKSVVLQLGEARGKHRVSGNIKLCKGRSEGTKDKKRASGRHNRNESDCLDND